jgi:hypothetical protein
MRPFVFAALLLIGQPHLSASDEKHARPVAECTVESAVVRHYLSDHPEFARVPLIKKPAEIVMPGDVLVMVAQKDPENEKTTWSLIMGREPHAMIVMEKEKVKGHLNSPALLGGNFITNFEDAYSYLILRPKFTPDLKARFGTDDAFRRKINDYLLKIEKVGLVYDPLMQMDVLKPGYTQHLREQIEQNCLKKTDLKPLYCTELTALPGALLDFPYPDGQKLETLFDEAILRLKAQSSPQDFEKNLLRDANEIIDMYEERASLEVEGLREKLRLAKTTPAVVLGIDSTRRSELEKEIETRIKEAEAHVALISATRPLVHEVLKAKAQGKAMTGPVAELLKNRVIRPHDFLLEAGKKNYEAIGLYTNSIPKECYAPPTRIAVDSPGSVTH